MKWHTCYVNVGRPARRELAYEAAYPTIDGKVRCITRFRYKSGIISHYMAGLPDGNGGCRLIRSTTLEGITNKIRRLTYEDLQ